MCASVSSSGDHLLGREVGQVRSLVEGFELENRYSCCVMVTHAPIEANENIVSVAQTNG